MKLLTTANTKIKKGEKLGFMSFGIHLAPSKLSGFNTCAWASKGCAISCLNTAGMGVFSNVQQARIAKTIMFFKEREKFMSQLVKEISSAIKKATKNDKIPCFRLNLTSDLPWEKIKFDGRTILETFPSVQFYDYTKSYDRMIAFLESRNRPKTWAGNLAWANNGGRDWLEKAANYHLTFSRSEETSDALCQSLLASGGNVAVVFRGSLPKTWLGFPVVNGDETDLRFLDNGGVVVGLVEKGLAKKDASGFVLEGGDA